MRYPHTEPTVWNRGTLIWGQLLFYLYCHKYWLPQFPTLYARVSSFVRTDVAGYRGPRPVEASPAKAPQTSSVLLRLNAAAWEGWPCGARPRELHFPELRSPPPPWPVGGGCLGFGPSGRRVGPLTPNLGLYHGDRRPGRACGDLGNSFPLSPLPHPWEHGPRVSPRG